MAALFFSGSAQADTPPVSGTLTFTGSAQQILFTGGSGTNSSIVYDPTAGITGFVLGGATGSWNWAINSGTNSLMDLDPSGLALYSPILPAPSLPVVFLSSTGETSYFTNSITLNGTDNQMPNQLLSGTASVLTQQLADRRYLQIPAASPALLAVGPGASATGTNSVAIGSGAMATGANAFSLGLRAYASGDASFAIGPDTVATGYSSFAAGGDGSRAAGDNSLALVGGEAGGAFSIALGESWTFADYSVVIGEMANGTGLFGVALGAYAASNGAGSVAIGASTTIGDSSVAIGNSTTNGNSSVAIGWGFGDGASSNAIGTGCESWGAASSAIGSYNTSLGDGSMALGYSTTAESMSQTVVGQFNILKLTYPKIGYIPMEHVWSPDDELFTVGNGTDKFHSSNALVVKKSGETTVYGSLIVSGTDQTNPSSSLVVNSTGGATLCGKFTVSGSAAGIVLTGSAQTVTLSTGAPAIKIVASGSSAAVLIPEQGDLSMGDYVNGPKPQ